MALSSTQVTLSTSTPALLARADIDGCVMYLHTQNTIYLGGATVSSSTGMRLDSAAGPVTIALGPTDAIYAVSNSGTPTVTLLLVNQS